MDPLLFAKRFSLEEAQALLPQVVEITEETVRKIRSIRKQELADEAVPDSHDSEQQIQNVLQQWAEEVTRLGVLPKGFFRCDFLSLNPDTFYCWTLGEKEITHTHKVYESFKDRRPLTADHWHGFEISRN